MKWRFFFAAAFVSVFISDLEARGPWTTLANCHFLVKRANDGDSFHVSVNGKEFLFRLYFVDTPETDNEFADRVAEQAKYFGLIPQQAIVLGELAKNFTREKLNSPFVVKTCWEDAMGRSKLERFYAIVQDDSGDLAEQLVENGLARLHGVQASPEGVTGARREWQKLNVLQLKAKREKVGGWGAGENRMMARTQDGSSTKGVDSFDAFFHPEKVAASKQNLEGAVVSPSPNAAVERNAAAAPQTAENASVPGAKLDVNNAAESELGHVPGIGSAIAQRIVAARPLKSADDLQNIKGIGHGKKYEQIRPYFY